MPSASSESYPASETETETESGISPGRVGLGNAVWSVAAQGLASASNFGVQMGLVITLSPSSFGSVVVGFAVFYLALALGRAWVGDPLVAITRSPIDLARLWPRSQRRLLQLGAMATMSVGLLAVVTAPVRSELVFLAVSIPVLLLQDGHRYRCWALKRYARAAVLDGSWLAVSVAVVLWVLVVRSRAAVDADVVMLAWVAGGAVSWLLARLLAGDDTAATSAAGTTAATTAASTEVAQEEREASRSLSLHQAILAVDANGLPAVVALVANATVTAGIRAAVLPFAPLTSVLAGLRVLALPLLRQAVTSGTARSATIKVVGVQAVVACALAGGILAVVTIVPAAWLGESGQLVRPWFAFGAVVVVSRMIGLPLADVLSLGVAPGRVAKIRLATSAIDWMATLLGAVAAGVQGAIVGRALAGVVSVGIWLLSVSLCIGQDGGTIPGGTAADGAVDKNGRGAGEPSTSSRDLSV